MQSKKRMEVHMKHKNKVKRLNRKRAVWDNQSERDKQGTRRPGSVKR